MNINFTPGPSQLYFTVPDHMRQALRENIGALSHRSKGFDILFQEATSGLRELLALPGDYHIFFVGSGTEIFERSLQNLAEQRAFHFVNGAFSQRFFEVASQLGKHPEKLQAPPGSAFADPKIPEEAELIVLTHNESSTGVSLPLDFIHGLQRDNNQLVIVDAVSSLPFPSFDYARVDSVFFSVQKGFGLPAGLGVWLVNDRCLARAESLQARGISIGSYHNLPTLHAHARKNQTPETPNVLGIYLLGKVVHDMLRRGIDKIRKETEYKAAVLYQALELHPILRAFVDEKAIQSKTVIAVDCGAHVDRVVSELRKNGLHPGDGYGESKKTQLRFANFPAHSREQFEHLADAITALKL